MICTGICIEPYLLQEETRSDPWHSDALIQRKDPRRAALSFRGYAPIFSASGNRLWRYTACEISVADPGAVPGASTNLPPVDAAIYGGELGSTRVVKVRSVARHDTAVIGSKFSCERQLRTRGARGLTPSGVKALSKSRFEGHRATEAPHSPVDHPPA